MEWGIGERKLPYYHHEVVVVVIIVVVVVVILVVKTHNSPYSITYSIFLFPCMQPLDA